MSVTAEEFITAVKQAASNMPDYVDSQPCEYVRQGHAGCIMGTAAWNLNLIGPEFEHGGNNDEDVYMFLGLLGIDIDGDQKVWLEAVQSAQDSGTPWEIALMKGDLALAEHHQNLIEEATFSDQPQAW